MGTLPSRVTTPSTQSHHHGPLHALDDLRPGHPRRQAADAQGGGGGLGCRIRGHAPAFWEIIALVVAVAETTRVQKGWNDPYNGKGLWLLKDDYTPGDLAFDPLGLTPDDSEEFEQMRLRELSHCRLAMIAISGMVAQELVDGKTLVGHFSS